MSNKSIERVLEEIKFKYAAEEIDYVLPLLFEALKANDSYNTDNELLDPDDDYPEGRIKQAILDLFKEFIGDNNEGLDVVLLYEEFRNDPRYEATLRLVEACLEESYDSLYPDEDYDVSEWDMQED